MLKDPWLRPEPCSFRAGLKRFVQLAALFVKVAHEDRQNKFKITKFPKSTTSDLPTVCRIIDSICLSNMFIYNLYTICLKFCLSICSLQEAKRKNQLAILSTRVSFAEPGTSRWLSCHRTSPCSSSPL